MLARLKIKTPNLLLLCNVPHEQPQWRNVNFPGNLFTQSIFDRMIPTVRLLGPVGNDANHLIQPMWDPPLITQTLA